MYIRSSLLVFVFTAAAFLTGCERTEPADSPAAAPESVASEAPAEPMEAPAEEPAVEQPAAAATSASEAGRTACGALSFVLPEGSAVEIRDGGDGGFSGAGVTLPDGVTMEVTVIGEAAAIGGDDGALQAKVQLWLDGLGPRMADEWTAEILPVEGEGVRGYYAVAKSELSGQPGKAFAINGFYLVDGHVAAIGAVHDDASGAVNERVIEVVRSAEWAGS